MKRRIGKIAAAFFVLVWATGAATQAQTFTVLYSFTGPSDGAVPFAGLLRDAVGNLYSTTNVGGAFPSPGGTVFKVDSSGNETVLYSFMGGSDGCRPQAALVMDQARNLYGPTTGGGGACGFGTVFKLDSFGNLAVLHSFTCSEGLGPGGPPLVMDTAGNLYGTTPGNLNNGCGFGTVFKLDTSGNYIVLHTFTGGSDGGSPSGVIMDTAGNLYGATFFGGASVFGTIFRIDTSGNFTVLYGGSGGGPLLRDQAGNLYGNSSSGTGASGGGAVFRLDTLGNYTVLYNFTSLSNPSALIMDKAGNLYGTTQLGGSFSNCNPTNSFGCGTVFKLDTLGNYTVLHSFTGGSDGFYPFGGLVMDTAGNLYGTASEGGFVSSNCPGGCGTVFKLTVQTPAPTVTSISPTSAIAGGAGFTLTVNGTNFVSGSTVNFNGNARTTTFVSAMQLTTAILASDIATAGIFNVTVTNPGDGTSTPASFTVLTPQQATQAIINAVNALFSQGVLNGGQDNSLVTQLQHATDLMNAGKKAGAIGNLDSFISEVNDLLSSGVLSASQAASLISAAKSVIAALS
ncbi:MAG TPA: choice-of-anchor tandem repeat GloVer-containing protein [Terriglobales bacterium]|nr:choice-of-anchor tandem repeat GloVer-containing protein [Terriglobales bacterium]